MAILTIIFSFILLICLPLGQLFPLELGNGIRVSFLDSGLVIFSICWISYALYHKPQLPKILLPLGIFTCVAALSLLIHVFVLPYNEFAVALLYLLRWIMYVSLIIPLINFDKEFKKKILYLLIIGSSIILVAGYLQYFLFPSLQGLTYEGWDPHLYRMFSTFFDPNFLGSFLVLAFLLEVNTFFSLNKKSWRYLLGLVAFATLVGILFTFSRSAYIALLVGISVFVYLKGYKKWLVVVLGSIFLIGGCSILLLNKQSEGTNLLRTASTAARLGNMQRAISIIHDAPILGVGFNAYRYAQHQKGFIGGEGWETSHSGGGINNSYLFVWATTGIIGLITFLFLLYKFFLNAKKKSPLQIVFIASLASVLVNSLFENTFFYPEILLWLVILAGLIERD